MKMKERNISPSIIRILLFWYREQLVCVKWGSSSSESFKVSNGVRQGSVMSPRLFAIYVNDLSKSLIASKVGCFIDAICYNHLFYADDLCLLAPSAIALQRLLDICHRFGIEHDVKYNLLKSVCIVFKPSRFKLKCPPVYLGDEIMNYQESVKYLGVLLTDNLCDNDEMLKHTRCLYARTNSFLRKFGACSLPVKLKFFQAYCTSFYCSYLWCMYSTQTIQKIRVAYNNAFRFLLGYDRICSASQMLVSNGVMNFDALMRKGINDFVIRVKCAPNILVKTLTENSSILSANMWQKWITSVH
jgi:hypothetical protein